MLMATIPAMPVVAAARTLGEHDTTLWRAVHHYVGQARARVSSSSVTHVAIDAAHTVKRPAFAGQAIWQSCAGLVARANSGGHIATKLDLFLEVWRVSCKA